MFKNFLSLAGAELFAKVLTFAAFAYLARVAGPDGFGYIEFAAAAVMCAGLIVEQGFNPFGAREIAKAPERTGALVSEIVLVRMLLAVGLYVALVMFALAVGRAAVQTRLLLVYGLSLLAMPLFLQWVFQGHDRMQTVAAIQLIRQLVFAVVVFALVRQASQIWLVGLAETLGATSAAAVGVWAYRRQLNGRLALSWQFSSQLLREGATIGLSQIFWVVKMSGATLILGLIASAEDVGYFGGAMRILMALHTFVWLYFFNLLPSLSRAWVAGDGSFAMLIARSLRLVALASLVGAGIWVAVAPLVVRVVYGERFTPAGVALQWFAGVCAVAALSGHYRFGLIAAGHQTAEMVTALVGAIAAMILIPVGYSMAGVGGAAAGLFVAEILIGISAWWLGTRRFQHASAQHFQPAYPGEVTR
ncbi:MAG: oligosaccharide flippase family protein [Acidobacteria bacterium]|nr:oligosaccharide flippase family protein [Acidobacteriota bacterium]